MAKPIITPAIPQKTFSKFWLRKLEIFADSPKTPVRIVLELVPSNGEEILNESIVSNVIPDAFELAKNDPEFKNALTYLIAVSGKYMHQKFSE